MEIVAKSGKKTLNVGSVLNEMMQRTNEKETVDFLDIEGNPFDTFNFPEPVEFEDRLATETVKTSAICSICVYTRIVCIMVPVILG
jgi:hypothetical protein